MQTVHLLLGTHQFAMSHPSVFYKYASASTTIKVLETGRLRWSSPLLFNDLSEFQRMPRFAPPVAEALSALHVILVDAAFGDAKIDEPQLAPSSQLLLALIRRLRDAGKDRVELIAQLTDAPPDADERIASRLREAFDGFGIDTARVLCVTTVFDNEAMWANYAEGHAGCVLGFRHIPLLDTPLQAARPVEYTEYPPVVGSGLDFLLYGDTPDLRSRIFDAVCFSKKVHWSYEKEWRAITWRPSERGVQSGDYEFYPGELESLTLGARATAETEAVVRSWLQSAYPQCSLFRLVIQHGVATRQKAYP